MPSARRQGKGQIARALDRMVLTGTPLNVENAVQLLRAYVALPDVTTRQGLKKLHDTYDVVDLELQQVYEGSHSRVGVRVGVMAFYAAMCVDNILCQKLLQEQSHSPDTYLLLAIVDNTIALLSFNATKHMALRLLASLVRYGKQEFHRTTILSCVTDLAKVADDNLNDPVICDLVVTILSQCLTSINPTKYEVDMGAQTLVAVVACMSSTHALPTCILEGLSVLGMLLATNWSQEWRDSLLTVCPESVGILVAGLHSPSWETRTMSLATLLCLYDVMGSGYLPGPVIDEQLAFSYISALPGLAGRLTPTIVESIENHSGRWEESTSYLSACVPWKLIVGFRDFCRNGDGISLGYTLFNLILSTEFAVPNDAKDWEEDGCHPFSDYADALPFCATALRSRGNHRDDLVVDVLDTMFKLKHCHVDTALTRVDVTWQMVLCLQAAKDNHEKHPEVAYFQLVILMLEMPTNPYQGLSRALVVRAYSDVTATTFVKHALLARRVEKYALAGVQKMMVVSAHPAGGRSTGWSAGHLYLVSALQHSKEFLATTPPCHLERGRIFGWYMILSIFLTTNTPINVDHWQNECRRYIEPYTEFCQLLGISPDSSPIVRFYRVILQIYEGSTHCYSAMFDRLEDDRPLRGPDLRPEEPQSRSTLPGYDDVIRSCPQYLINSGWRVFSSSQPHFKPLPTQVSMTGQAVAESPLPFREDVENTLSINSRNDADTAGPVEDAFTTDWWHDQSHSPTPAVERFDLEFDESYLLKCQIPSFNPKRLRMSNIKILFLLGRMFGPGISQAQFVRVMRMCALCHNYCFIERQHLHRCKGAVLRTQADGFDLVMSMATYEEHAGLSRLDLYRLLTRCSVCCHICMEGSLGVHDCPDTH
ncbi:hypothetical protein FA13DRAFT_1793755 [Coprinellus micaceus]|uniref:Rapamycin-insensitive companion of mTOR domain-containing protein n=1 Tax=Coprinellus micaceus TaxID=71717 RepID=A0A4Y7T422_COPMI|nr:hypothetical protein FA13DRAFT_1793755 [Coprinellus micaceus]